MSSAALESLRKNSELMRRTDQRISVAWIFLPIIAIVLAVVVVSIYGYFVYSTVTSFSSSSIAPSYTPPPIGAVTGSIGLVFGIVFVADIIYLYFFYMLIRRRNQHFPRQHAFLADLTSVLRAGSVAKGANIDALLGSIEGSLRQSEVEETEKSAVLWVVLMLVPLVNIIAFLYVFYFLTGDFYKHERREDGILSDVERALSALGIQFVFHRNDPVPHRSFVVYLILTIVTLGIFGLYWEYVFIKDPNNHFANHWVYEPQLIQLVSPLAA